MQMGDDYFMKLYVSFENIHKNEMEPNWINGFEKCKICQQFRWACELFLNYCVNREKAMDFHIEINSMWRPTGKQTEVIIQCILFTMQIENLKTTYLRALIGCDLNICCA